MSGVRIPVVGRTYNVLCPICSSNVSFDCRGTSVYGIQCHICHTVVDLRNPSVPLPPNDTGELPDNGGNSICSPVRYSPEVEESGGFSATAQLSMVIASAVEEQNKEMPTTMNGETSQAFSARRMQAMSERFSFLYPLVYALEFIVFGTKPAARIGHVRVFQKRLPFVGVVNVPVPKTSPSYSMPLTVFILLFSGTTWYARSVDDEWMWHMHAYVSVLAVLFLLLMPMSVYTDPGFVRPAYLLHRDGHAGELTLKDIELQHRESLWETVDGEQVERKWCSTCEMHRPPRAAHCYLCGLCVLEHDHHCSVIGACVGRRNLLVFYAFVAASSALALVAGGSMAVSLYNSGDALGWWSYVFSVLLDAILILTGGSTAGLLVSLTVSLITNATTRERLQNVFADRRNPFDRGVLRNMCNLFSRRDAPSLFNDDDFVRVCAERVEKRDTKRDDAGVTVV
ncbi:S-acyltransferase [Trypanosoma grayi]|uniref:S-acyltransferase n=1 Tax=Trypanosoma grayi TaxID=71804 RepID=UPI0004F45BE0|nr:S-acyltransferase [Trypanosoma grayi]KEG15356.1 S-acyltransferase [Trypanosoma grayi]